MKSGDMWPYNPLTREKFALKNKKMKGYAEELQQVGVVLGEKELKKVGRKRPGCLKSVYPLNPSFPKQICRQPSSSRKEVQTCEVALIIHWITLERMATSLESDIVDVGGDDAGAKKRVRFHLSKVDGSNECLEVEVSDSCFQSV